MSFECLIAADGGDDNDDNDPAAVMTSAVIMTSESWRKAVRGTELCPDWGAAPACDH